MAISYPGNTTPNVNRDAKYSVKRNGGDWAATLEFRLGPRLRTLLSSEDHSRLVDLVNAVKVEHNGQGGGAFYLNEYDHVLVATEDGIRFAGNYEERVTFEFDGAIVSPHAEGLEPGEIWAGPHAGMRHVLAAGGDDIYYERTDGRVTERVFLSDHVGTDAAVALARRLLNVRGESGRIYINECGEFFAPIEPDGWMVYLGNIDEDPWFPPPSL